jgi:hypothetical protein
MSILLAIDVSLDGAREDARPASDDFSVVERRVATQYAARSMGDEIKRDDTNKDRWTPHPTGQGDAAVGLAAVRGAFLANDRRHGVFDP